MAEQNQTTFENKCSIIEQLWLTYRYDEEFADYFEFADLGVPLAYVIANDIVKATPEAEKFVSEAFEFLIVGLGIEDTGFESLDDLLTEVSE